MTRAVLLGIALGLVLGAAGQLAPDLDRRLGGTASNLFGTALVALVALGVAVTEDGVRDALRVVGCNGA